MEAVRTDSSWEKFNSEEGKDKIAERGMEGVKENCSKDGKGLSMYRRGWNGGNKGRLNEERGGGIVGRIQEKRLGSRSQLMMMMMMVVVLVLVYVCVLAE